MLIFKREIELHQIAISSLSSVKSIQKILRILWGSAVKTAQTTVSSSNKSLSKVSFGFDNRVVRGRRHDPHGTSPRELAMVCMVRGILRHQCLALNLMKTLAIKLSQDDFNGYLQIHTKGQKSATIHKFEGKSIFMTNER